MIRIISHLVQCRRTENIIILGYYRKYGIRSIEEIYFEFKAVAIIRKGVEFPFSYNLHSVSSLLIY